MILPLGYLAMLTAPAKASAADSIWLVREGQPCASIAVGQNASASEKGAAEEMARYTEKISGQRLPVVSEGSEAGQPAIYIGNTHAGEKWTAQLTDDKVGYDGYILAPVEGGLALVGRREESVWFAVYDALEQLGCRFFMPGPDGEVVPSASSLSLPLAERSEKPAIEGRFFAISSAALRWTAEDRANWADWYRKNRLGGNAIDHGHALARHLPPERYFAEHPEYFALVNGKRMPSQPCMTNPDVINIITESVRSLMAQGARSVSLSMNDTQEFCECPNCTALTDPKTGDVGRLMLTLVNEVARRVRPEFPDRYICYYAQYGRVGLPPEGMKVEPNVVAVLFPKITDHPIDARMNPRGAREREIFEKWRAMGANIAIYDYLQTSELEVPNCRTVGSVIRLAARNGALFCYHEVLGRSWMNNISMYVAARMMWNPNQDLDALLDDFHSRFYGAAAKPMRSFYRRLDRHSESYDPDLTEDAAAMVLWTPEVMQACREDLDRAAQLADNDLTRKRVRMAAVNFRLDELMLAVKRAEVSLAKSRDVANRRAYRMAYGRWERYYEEVKPLNVSARVLAYWYERVPRLPPEYRSLLLLPRSARFQYDPKNVGDKEDWYREDLDDSSWDRISTMTWWEPQGYPDYDGHAWYRVRFSVSASMMESPLLLYFSGVDDHAWVYLNGKYIGSHALGGWAWDQPFAIPVDKGVLREGENILAVHVYDMLGMGGIFGPVWLATPAEPPQG